MSSVAIRTESLAELLGQRDRLVRAIQAGMASGSWDAVMPAFDGLLAAIARVEDEASRAGGTG
jgi:hypothetical protein